MNEAFYIFIFLTISLKIIINNTLIDRSIAHDRTSSTVQKRGSDRHKLYHFVIAKRENNFKRPQTLKWPFNSHKVCYGLLVYLSSDKVSNNGNAAGHKCYGTVLIIVPTKRLVYLTMP